MNIRPTRTTALAILAMSAVLLAGCSTAAPVAQDSGGGTRPSPASTVTPSASPADETAASVDAQLRYLIEEEKLAHDVYTALGEIWGARIFENIASSESTHQDAVAALLPVYDVADPRVDEAGVFTDPVLQSFYDDMIATGSQSLADAITVGITIEKTDIADLSAALPAAPDDVATLLQRLLTASENNLAAFERQA